MTKLIIHDKGEAEYEGSRMFGDPLVPEKWAMKEPWSEDCYFICQINLEENKFNDNLPKKGMIYVFEDMSSEETAFTVLYTDKEPDTIYEDCNLGFEDEVNYDIFTDYVISFEEGDSDKSVLCQQSDEGLILLRIVPSDFDRNMFGGKVLTIYADGFDSKSKSFLNVRAQYL